MRLATPDREWQVEPATLTATGHRFGDGEWLLVLHHGHIAGTVRARRTPDGDRLDSATLVELAALGVPLAELRPEPEPPSSPSSAEPNDYLPANVADLTERRNHP